jgi:hypothetical protein
MMTNILTIPDVKPLILLYEPGWAIKLLDLPRQVEGAQLSTDSALLPDAHVVVFHIPTNPDLEEVVKYPGQLWVAFSLESDVNYPSLSNLEFMRPFDLTMTYRLDSDIPVPYLGPWKLESLRTPPLPKTAESPVAYFASNVFDHCGRVDYVRRLMQHLAVDSYGQSLNNRKLAGDNGQSSKLAAIARYKFTLAFENSISADYVTEKFFEPLMAGSVPVYRGAPNIRDFAPAERCFIDASRFRGPRQLAEHLLHLEYYQAEYESYLHWKTQPFDPKFVELMNRFSGDPLQRLAAKLSLRNGVLMSEHVQRDPIHKALRWLNAAGGNRAGNNLTPGDAGFPD